ncbi:MAG: phosphorylase [Nitrospinaceae bacterium]|nr:MTAP family purine nucleoside phosphorylase [Nitrospinaceae bacterium]NIR56180.1 MTAP family purine nucleoside phosphorylase [Nitrospinaceae bacterium]NIS86636.1 MTAP family purine nucleoside phosphorylase [Nitrospinaceae bacterium]NIT83469.1 MTAP family purine nucleoside phosphorylase [Nitrospinaceae bacterium]NIU45674.1 MTAP family purine nucleoside phosphorylase [Nitrospinaceae bacterium]
MSTPLAVIGGSGAYHLLAGQGLGTEVDCRTRETPFGSSAPVHRFKAGDLEFLFLSRHGETDYSVTAPFVNYRANIYALKDCGVERIVSWSGPGIINSALRPGEFVVPHDIIDETRNRESTFFKGTGVGFIRQSHPFCPEVRSALHEAAHQAGLAHHEEGVYVCTEGPRLESPAEIRKFRIIGADLVGMTLAPEAFLARELEMCYAPVCYLTNFAEGVVERDFKTGQLFEGMQTEEEKVTVEQAVRRFPALLAATLLQLVERDRACHCKDALQRYRDKGMIGNDWRTWIGSP